MLRKDYSWLVGLTLSSFPTRHMLGWNNNLLLKINGGIVFVWNFFYINDKRNPVPRGSLASTFNSIFDRNWLAKCGENKTIFNLKQSQRLELSLRILRSTFVMKLIRKTNAKRKGQERQTVWFLRYSWLKSKDQVLYPVRLNSWESIHLTLGIPLWDHLMINRLRTIDYCFRFPFVYLLI